MGSRGTCWALLNAGQDRPADGVLGFPLAWVRYELSAALSAAGFRWGMRTVPDDEHGDLEGRGERCEVQQLRLHCGHYRAERPREQEQDKGKRVPPHPTGPAIPGGPC